MHQMEVDTRIVVWQGHPDSVAAALRIICDAIARYKELCEGAYSGAIFLERHTPPTYMHAGFGCIGLLTSSTSRTC